MTNDESESPDRCAQCGTHLTVGDWHPVMRETGEDEPTHYVFCDEACKSEWDTDD